MNNFTNFFQLILGTILYLSISTGHAHEFAPQEGKLAASYFQSIRDNFAKSKSFSGTWVASTKREALLKSYSEEKPQSFIQGAKAWLDKYPEKWGTDHDFTVA
jgi:antibiotic biosynthesis monooxygenase (ABM) superfamily enzyme